MDQANALVWPQNKEQNEDLLFVLDGFGLPDHDKHILGVYNDVRLLQVFFRIKRVDGRWDKIAFPE